jgi:hypothetical protein
LKNSKQNFPHNQTEFKTILFDFGLELPLTLTTIINFFETILMKSFIPFQFLILCFLLQFTGCQISSNKKTLKAPETREEKLSFYRGQLFSFETDIDFHMKHRLDLSLKTDYEKMEETLNSLSTLLEKADQEMIEQMIKDMKSSMDEFIKLKNFSIFSRQNEKLFSKLKKLKKILVEKEKDKSKLENKGKK